MAASPPSGTGTFPPTVEPTGTANRDPAELYAALDLGTNSCRMLIAQPAGNRFHVVDSFSKTVSLGTGLEKHGRLSRSSINRTISALRVCRKKLEHHQVSRMRLVATEACRRADNGAHFIKRVRNESGLELEIIKPEEEARLAVISCAPLVSTRTEQLLVVDIGGGSTELVWIDLSEVPAVERAQSIMRLKSGFETALDDPQLAKAKVVDWISVPVGVATLNDQYSDVAEDSARFALMSWFFEEQIVEFSPYKNASAENSSENFQIVGTSGTVTTVAASHLGLTRYDRSKVDGLSMTTTQIDAVINDYLAMGASGRRRDPRIGKDRQRLILSGVAILQTLMRVWPTDRLSVADRGLREGLLYSQMSEDGVLEDRL